MEYATVTLEFADHNNCVIVWHANRRVRSAFSWLHGLFKNYGHRMKIAIVMDVLVSSSSNQVPSIIITASICIIQTWIILPGYVMRVPEQDLWQSDENCNRTGRFSHNRCFLQSTASHRLSFILTWMTLQWCIIRLTQQACASAAGDGSYGGSDCLRNPIFRGIDLDIFELLFFIDLHFYAMYDRLTMLTSTIGQARSLCLYY